LTQENEQPAKLWWEENVTTDLVSIDQCVKFAQKFWTDDMLKHVYGMVMGDCLPGKFWVLNIGNYSEDTDQRYTKKLPDD